DTALRTADSGYLTRRLVDVAQDVIVREVDCGTDRSLWHEIGEKNAAGAVVRKHNVENTGFGRTLAGDVVDADGNVVLSALNDTSGQNIDKLINAGTTRVRSRWSLTFEAKGGVGSTCYGRSTEGGKPVAVAEAIGIMAAQSIREPGTQLSMRTFHVGGSAGQDITHGLPRVQDLFEARIPKCVAPISEMEGRIRVDDT